MHPLPKATVYTHEQEVKNQDSVRVTPLASGADPTVTPSRRAHDGPGLIINPTHMAWRPYENLIDGELDNRTPGKVTGWIRFSRRGKKPLKVSFDLEGDFHEDINGKVMRPANQTPSDRNGQLDRDGTYMEGFCTKQRGSVGDITAGLSLGPWTEELAQKLMAQNELIWDENGLLGAAREERRREFAERYRKHIDAGDLYYPYVAYPYIEWYSDTNGRVVLELDASQVEVIDGVAPVTEKLPAELVEDEKSRTKSMATFLTGFREFSRRNRNKGAYNALFGAEMK